MAWPEEKLKFVKYPAQMMTKWLWLCLLKMTRPAMYQIFLVISEWGMFNNWNKTFEKFEYFTILNSGIQRLHFQQDYCSIMQNISHYFFFFPP